MARRSSKSKDRPTGASSSNNNNNNNNTLEKIKMLRNFCGSAFSENDLSSCLSQAGYNVELAAGRLLSGEYKPAKSAAPKSAANIVSISSVKTAPTSATTTPSSAVGKKRPSPSAASASRPDKKRSPHVIPPTPANNETGRTVTTKIHRTPKATPPSTALLLCERWLVGTCTTRSGRVSYQEPLELSHYLTGNNLNVRFKGTAVEGNLSRSLSAMLTPLLRVDHQPKLIHLHAEALMDDRNIPMGGEVPLKLAVYITAPRLFFAIFDEVRANSDSKSSSSMFFANRNIAQRKGSRMTLSEAAFSFLQWAEYGDLPEIPDFSASAKDDDNNSSNRNELSESSDSSDDAIMMDEEDFTVEDETNKEERPEWAKSVNESESDKTASLPEMDEPQGFKGSVVLRPYQRQALYWMMKREQQGESRKELEQQLELLSELASSQNQKPGKSPGSSFQGVSNVNGIKPEIRCDCGPVQVSEAAKKEARTLDGQVNPVNHPLWQSRYLGNHSLQGATLFYVNELLGIATCQPPAPPKECSGGILADDMGLGKTVMLLALILRSKEESADNGACKRGPTVVVAPLSLISQWEEEIGSKTSLSCLVWYGDQTKGKTSKDDFNCDVVITSYGTIQAEMQRKLKKEDKSRRGNGLLDRDWMRVILDEAHCVKNEATLASKACCALKATYRWVVTGTVIHNSLEDVYALIKFLEHQPWCETSFWKAAISAEMIRTNDGDAADNGDGAEESGMTVALGRVRRLLAPLMLRRTKHSLSADGTPILSLPTVEAQVINVQLTEAEREFYNALLEKSQDIFAGFIKSGAASKSWLAIFSLLARLRMACDHIALTVKSHIDDAEWNIAVAKDGTQKEQKAPQSPAKATGQDTASVDDAFITGLLQKFRESAGASKGRNNDPANSYSDQIAHALNRTIADNATHTADECPICLDRTLIADACITNCGHIFCKECLLGVMKDNTKISSKKDRKLPDGPCPVCQANVESSKIIVLSKGKEGGFTSSFLMGQQFGAAAKAVAAKSGSNDAARQVLEKAVNGAKSSKLDAVIRELYAVWEMDPGTNVIIFSQFLGFLDLLETSLRSNGIPFGRLDGKMSLKQRVASLDLFKSDSKGITKTISGQSVKKDQKGSVMLVSMKAGGVGLNLQSISSTVFIIDPWWNQSIEDQCINRVLRIGQKADKVRVRKFVVEDSVETKIVELQKKKKRMASEVYSEIEADGTMSDSRPTMDDFKLIFGSLK